MARTAFGRRLQKAIANAHSSLGWIFDPPTWGAGMAINPEDEELRIVLRYYVKPADIDDAFARLQNQIASDANNPDAQRIRRMTLDQFIIWLNRTEKSLALETFNQAGKDALAKFRKKSRHTPVLTQATRISRSWF